jgi:hypothetical protein
LRFSSKSKLTNLQIIRDMELVWNMPIHLLNSNSDSKVRSDALICHEEWRHRILPSLAKACRKDAHEFLEIAQECETEHIAAADKCKEAASQHMQKDSLKIKKKSGDIDSQSNGNTNPTELRSDNHIVVKVKCRCHKKPCTCGAKSHHTPTTPAIHLVEPVLSSKRARPASEDNVPSNDTRPTIHADRVLDSAEEVVLARDPEVSRHCKDALESLLKHRRSEFFLAPGVNSQFFANRAECCTTLIVFFCRFFSAQDAACCALIFAKLIATTSNDVTVDADSLGLSDYFSIVKQPMDLSSIASKLEKRKYKFLKQVQSMMIICCVDM